jgi:hypothetical protein
MVPDGEKAQMKTTENPASNNLRAAICFEWI